MFPHICVFGDILSKLSYPMSRRKSKDNLMSHDDPYTKYVFTSKGTRVLHLKPCHLQLHLSDQKIALDE